MAAEFRDVSDAELALLRVLWERGPRTARQLVEVIYPAGRPADFSTVQKLLERLEAKTCVGRDRGVRPHLFSAAIDQTDLIVRRLRIMADKICDGSLTPLLTHLVRDERLTAKDRRALRELLDEREQGKLSGK